MGSLTEENYLKALVTLTGVSGEVSVTDLAGRLHIKLPTVTNMMKRLAKKKLVYHKAYRPLRLTDKGMREALLIIRKHRLIEMFLVEKMNFGWEEVHDIAEQIEHVEAPHLFEKMDKMLGFPKIDPHGEPIPDKEGNIEQGSYQKLSTYKAGATVTLRAVGDSCSEFLKFLSSRGLRLGVDITIRHVEPMDGSVVVSYDKKRREMLSHTICDRLLVEKL